MGTPHSSVRDRHKPTDCTWPRQCTFVHKHFSRREGYINVKFKTVYWFPVTLRVPYAVMSGITGSTQLIKLFEILIKPLHYLWWLWEHCRGLRWDRKPINDSERASPRPHSKYESLPQGVPPSERSKRQIKYQPWKVESVMPKDDEDKWVRERHSHSLLQSEHTSDFPTSPLSYPSTTETQTPSHHFQR